MADRPPHLRAVKPNEKPTARKSAATRKPATRKKAAAPRKPKTITSALTGSSCDVLTAMRAALAVKLDNNELASNSIASAYKELRELDRLIRMAEAAEEDDDGDGTPEDEAFDEEAI